MAMFVEVKVCIPESRLSILSPYFTAECVLLERGVLWLVSAAAERDLQADEEFPGPPHGHPINDGSNNVLVLNSSNHGVNILNAE